MSRTEDIKPSDFCLSFLGENRRGNKHLRCNVVIIIDQRVFKLGFAQLEVPLELAVVQAAPAGDGATRRAHIASVGQHAPRTDVGVLLAAANSPVWVHREQHWF